MPNIAFISRNTLFSTPGGDTIQIQKTAEALRNIGYNIDIHLAGSKIDIEKYDLLHFFNIIRPADILPYIEEKRPYVISTIYVEYGEFESKARKGPIGFLSKTLSSFTVEYLKTIFRAIKKQQKWPHVSYIIQGQFNSMKNVIAKSRALLPNSKSEANRVQTHFNTKTPQFIIPNAIDLRIFNTKTEPNNKYTNTVVCAARIEGRKNQLSLIRASKNQNWKLIIVGTPSPNHLDYFEHCKAEAGDNVEFISHISQEALASLLYAAKVHAMPSWFETTGLSSLEAAAMECNVVITRKGDQVDYFGDNAFYCEPDDVTSIRDAITRALEAPTNTSFASFVRENYNWEVTAQKTAEAYQHVLGIREDV